jgi:protoheme ferro-lyase
VKYYPLPLAVVVPQPVFLSIIDNVVRSLPEQAKLGGVVAVKEQVDALANLYVSEWMRDKLNPKNRQELEKMESHLRKLGLLY